MQIVHYLMRGFFLEVLDKGWVTKGDLHALLPHPINLCIVTLDGGKLREVYEQSLNEEWPEIEIKGLGFRGTIMGAMIHERLYKNRKGHFSLEIGKLLPEKPIHLQHWICSHLVFFSVIKEAEKEYYMPELIRDVFGWYGNNPMANEWSL